MNKTAAMQTIRLNLNGKAVEVLADPAKRLSDLLSDDLGLTGTKIGCHSGDCGACTVLLDGQQICSCITAAAQCAGREVTTVEGLACDGKISRLQQAFLAHGATQCGICTPGMLMAAADVLRRHPDPTEQQVQDGLAGVLCRCTGYRKIIEAVLAVAHGEFDLPQPAAGQAVGARLARLDGQAKITGAEKFGADQYPESSLWLRTVRSPLARATFTLGDLDAFKRRHPEVVAVFSAADVPENSFSVFPEPKDQPVLADGHVRIRGEAVLLIVGEMDAVKAIAESDIPILSLIHI